MDSKRKVIKVAGLTKIDPAGSNLLLASNVVSSWADSHRVQKRTESLSKRRGHYFRWKVSNIGWDSFPSEKLRHFIAKGVAVVVQQVVFVATKSGFSQRSQILHKNIFWNLCGAQVHC